MNTHPFVVFLLSVLPGIFWVWFFYRQDLYEKEPKPLVLRAFLFGALMVVPAGILEVPFRGWLEGSGGLVGLLLVTFGVVGLGEEALKLFAVSTATRREPALNELMDGIVYSVTAGLGFATLENIMYMGAFGPQVGAVRAVLTNLAHASFSGIAGYYLGVARCAGGGRDGRRAMLKGLTLATLVHGAYDFIVIGGLLPGYTALLLIVLVYLVLRQFIVSALRQSPFRS